jgi:ABC-type nitrate/sulfonate/bicarbonate transport system substrate-binding protein
LAVGDGPVQYEALQQGTIEAAAMSLPWPLLARQDGFSLLVNAADVINMPVAGLGTTQSKIEVQRDQVKRTIKAHIQALRHIRTQQADAIRLIAELFETDHDTAAQAFALILPAFSQDGAVEREGIEAVVELEREGDAPVSVTFEQLVDTSLVADAQRELVVR